MDYIGRSQKHDDSICLEANKKQSALNFCKQSLQISANIIHTKVLRPLFNTLPIKQRSALRKFVNFAIKGPIKGADEKAQERIHDEFDGQTIGSTLKSNYRYANEFLKSLKGKEFKDMEGLKNIVNHRKSMLELNNALPWRKPKLFLKKLQDLPLNGSFTIAGGCIGHYVSYEVKRKNGDYYFIIHNRGFGRDSKMHGPLKIKHEGKIYAKTSVEIKVNQELLNFGFFARLVLSSAALDMTRAYNIIQKHLLDRGGEIQISSLEEKLRQNSQLQSTLGAQLIKDDPCFHTTQSFGTCTESNLTSPEKGLAEPETLKALKLFTITKLTDEVSRGPWVSKKTKQEISAYSNIRVQKLTTEI